MFKQLTKETRDRKLKELEKAEGIICINPEDYVMVHEANLIWQCPNGHQWQSRWSNIFNAKSRCPECYNRAFLISTTTKYKYERCSSCKHQHRSIAQYPCVSCNENGKPDYFDVKPEYIQIFSLDCLDSKPTSLDKIQEVFIRHMRFETSGWVLKQEDVIAFVRDLEAQQ